MLGVVHFLRSFFKVRDVVPGTQNRVCLQSFAGVAAPWAVCGWLRGNQDPRGSRSFSMDVLDLEVVACPSVALGTAGTEGERGAQGLKGSREGDLTEAGETGESLATPGFLTALAG